MSLNDTNLPSFADPACRKTGSGITCATINIYSPNACSESIIYMQIKKVREMENCDVYFRYGVTSCPAFQILEQTVPLQLCRTARKS